MLLQFLTFYYRFNGLNALITHYFRIGFPIHQVKDEAVEG